MPRKAPDDFVLFAGTVIIDTREQAPFAFAGLRADARGQHRPLIVPTQVSTLATGDYSLAGWEDRICVERKSLVDLYQTLTRERARFERELERMEAFAVSAVVCEADWFEILGSPPSYTTVPPKVIHRSVIALSQRFPQTHWYLMPGRAIAETTTFRILERFYADCTRRTHGGAQRVGPADAADSRHAGRGGGIPIVRPEVHNAGGGGVGLEGMSCD